VKQRDALPSARPLAPSGRLLGYARVSTDEQNTLRQEDELRAAGCLLIQRENASGANRSRPVLSALLRDLSAGDTLVVVKLDRLARSLEHLLEIVNLLQARGAFLRVLGDPIDTATPQGRLMLQMLGAIAEFERALIRERVQSGLARARREGRVGGNPALRRGDPKAIQALKDRGRAHYLEELILFSPRWLPRLKELRAEELSWRDCANQLGRHPKDGRRWTAARLRHAVETLAGEGMIAPDALFLSRRPPPRRQSEADPRAMTIIEALRDLQPGTSLRAIAQHLQRKKIPAPRGGAAWSPATVRRFVARLNPGTPD